MRHFEGVDLGRAAPRLREMLDAQGAEFEDSTEDLRGQTVYTNVATLQTGGGMTLWLKVTQVEGVGVVVDAKLFHSTEQSAEADERLSLFMDELQERLGRS